MIAFRLRDIPGKRYDSRPYSTQLAKAATPYSLLWFRRKESSDSVEGLITEVTKYSE
jgi:hypothetical protein